MTRLIGRSVCSKKVVTDFWDVHFSCVTVEGRVIGSNINDFCSFSSNLFAILICYLEVGDVGFGFVVGNVMFVNCTGDMAIVFFYSYFPNICWILLCRKGCNFLWAGPFVDFVFILAVMEFYP